MLFMPEDGEEGPLLLRRIDERPGKWPRELYIREEDAHGQGRLHRISLAAGHGVAPWGNFNLSELLDVLAEYRDSSLEETAKLFTVTQVPKSDEGWLYHPVLGFARK